MAEPSYSISTTYGNPGDVSRRNLYGRWWLSGADDCVAARGDTQRKCIESRLKEMVSRDKLETPLRPQVWRIPCRLLNPV